MATESELLAQIATLGPELEKRARLSRKLHRYKDGECPFPTAVVRARMTHAYQVLMPMAQAAWGALVVESVEDRLEVAGITAEDKDAANAVWGVWQANRMDAESQLAHAAALTTGRAYATVWPDEAGEPEIVLDTSEQMIVQYREGSRRRRQAALRYWTEGNVPMATLYRPDGIYKFQGPKNSSGFHGTQWTRRDVLDEAWPLENPLNVVPVVELAVNRELRPGAFGYARGEFQHCLGLIDRINLLTFLGLVVALWLGFPLRGVIGDKILRDDDGNPIPPFDAEADSIFQLENKEAKLAEFKAADRGNLSIYAELDQLASITKTPRHYMPMQNGMTNLSADAIRASEGGLHAKVPKHKGTLGEGWEDVLRLSGLMLDQAVDLSPRAQLMWVDHESRSLAERADAAVKLNGILPWQALAERVLNATQDDITRWETMRASDALSTLVAAARQPASPAGAPAPAPANGNGNAPQPVAA